MSTWGNLHDYPEQTLQSYGDADKTSQHILETIQSLFAQAGVTLPQRQYVAAGTEGSVAYDTEQMTVTCTSIYLGLPGEPQFQPTGCMLNMSGDFVVELVRCYPVPKETKRNPDKVVIPSVATMNAAASVAKIDAQILLEAAFNVQSTQGVIAQVNFGAPSGAMQAVTLTMSCSLTRN